MARLGFESGLAHFGLLGITLVTLAPQMAFAAAVEKRESTISPRTVRLDTASLRKHYLEGEFTTVADSLEAWRAKGSVGTRSDSVFAYRHLGIVYASSDATKIRAESYFNLLLKLEPDIEILDPYVSAKVDALWDQVRERNSKVTGKPLTKRSQDLSNATPRQLSGDNKTQVTLSDKSGFPWLWTVGGAVLVGGAAVAFYVWDQKQQPSQDVQDPEALLDTAAITIKVPRKP